MEKASGNQHIKLTEEIRTDDMNPSTYDNKYRVNIGAANGLHFLDINTSWSPEGDMKFGTFRKKVNQLKYVRKVSTHTPNTLRAPPLVFLKCL